ncbi:hypothetical protein HOF92_00495 [bacterium]|nr:hypothetical protein [bacterium]
MGQILDGFKEGATNAFARPSRRLHYVLAETLWDNRVSRGKIYRTEMAAALPDRSALNRTIMVYYPPTGRVIRCKVRDIGPWHVGDAYWKEQRKPRSLSYPVDPTGQRITFPSGISLSPQVWYRLGIRRDIAFRRGHQGTIGWRFVD